MAWNDNNGPWGKPPTNSSKNNGSGNSGGKKPKKDDDLDEIFRRAKQFMSSGNGGKPPASINFSPKFFVILALLLLGGWLATGFYTVDTRENALVLRFGKQVRIDKPGLNYHLPYPIERVIKQRVTDQFKDDIGYRPGSDFSREILVLTGDENIININFEVQWQIRDIGNYVFNVRNPRQTLTEAAESAMREVIGTTPINEILSSGRTAVQVRIKELLQQVMDNYSAGIEISRINLKGVPPSMVDDAFKDVQAARINQEDTVNKAIAYENEVTFKAKGEAEKMLQQSEGYKEEIINKAIGETKRFLAVYEQYRIAKSVTKSRIYMETMENILKHTDKVIIDNEKSGILPYLPLDRTSSRSAR